MPIRLWRHKLWNELYLSNQAFFSTCPKGQDKSFNILRTKRYFRMNWKAFFITFEGLSLKQIIFFFLEGKNLTLSNVFNSVKDKKWQNRLRKEINRLISKGMSNIYLKITIETLSKLRFSGFKKFVTRSVLGSSNLRRYHWILKLFVAT